MGSSHIPPFFLTHEPKLMQNSCPKLFLLHDLTTAAQVSFAAHHDEGKALGLLHSSLFPSQPGAPVHGLHLHVAVSARGGCRALRNGTLLALTSQRVKLMASTVGTPPNGSPSRTVLRERALKHCSSVLFTGASRKMSISSEVRPAPSGAGSIEYVPSIGAGVGSHPATQRQGRGWKSLCLKRGHGSSRSLPSRSEELTKGREGRGLAGDLGTSPVPVSLRERLLDTRQRVLLKKSHYFVPFPHPIKPHAIWLSLSYLRQVSHHLCPSVLEAGLSHGHPGMVSRQE